MSPDELLQAHRALRDRLFEAGLLVPTRVDGIYGRSAAFERVLDGVTNAVRRISVDDRATVMEYPPLIPKVTFDEIGYLRNFPQLAGPVYSFLGGNKEHTALLETLDAGEPYEHALQQTQLTLSPACCYSIYPSVAGTLPDDGHSYEIRQYCFRHEPSEDPMRLQAFRQIEHIRIGTPDQVLDWRERWLGWAPELFEALQLNASSDVANDPFFGRTGRLMSMSQREQQLKIEFLVPVFGDEHPTACASINYHQDHFGELFHIHGEDDAVAHSSCIGFGLERCTVALFARHGLDSDRWPAAVRSVLWP